MFKYNIRINQSKTPKFSVGNPNLYPHYDPLIYKSKKPQPPLAGARGVIPPAGNARMMQVTGWLIDFPARRQPAGMSRCCERCTLCNY